MLFQYLSPSLPSYFHHADLGGGAMGGGLGGGGDMYSGDTIVNIRSSSGWLSSWYRAVGLCHTPSP